ncbi:MlaD family protein [Synechococcus sp. CCY9202]|uniref:MlaD family protein n=1 Tax=Synechococcus sp. CCY9202 TaxID=174698 RepID=UPI002B1EC71F|nr:MlaD family protein [Synechococcus sp. CCY9202]MEA5424144.1 MlaD family protein [Synechococcus sp. CCY9202]
MRRSVREALVGFSLLAAIVGGGALWLWLKGISLRRDTWTVQASFQDAAGLADRSPVSFRGVLVGNVRRVRVTPEAVLADLEITDPDLRLARPTQALVGTGSLLGGDAVVALVSSGKPLPASTPGPRSPGCNTKLMLCNGSRIEGGAQASLGTVTETMQRILAESERQKLVDKLVGTTVSFDRTSNEADRFLREAQKLVQELNTAVKKADPILDNLNTATVEAAQAGRHVRNLTAALDNPQTVSELKGTVTNAEKLTARWEAVGGDVNKLTGDPQFVDGIRSLAIGLGKFFEELYPAQTGQARDKAAREKAEREKRDQAVREQADREKAGSPSVSRARTNQPRAVSQ